MKGLPIVFFLSLAFAAAQPAYAQDSKWRVITEQGISHYEKGEYDRAVAAIKKSLAVAEKEYGPDHPETATSLNNLAELYRGRNEAQAHALYKRALAIREKSFGPQSCDCCDNPEWPC